MRRGISARNCVNVNDAMHESDYTCMVYELSNAEHKYLSWQLSVRWFSENSAKFFCFLQNGLAFKTEVRHE